MLWVRVFKLVSSPDDAIKQTHLLDVQFRLWVCGVLDPG